MLTQNKNCASIALLQQGVAIVGKIYKCPMTGGMCTTSLIEKCHALSFFLMTGI